MMGIASFFERSSHGVQNICTRRLIWLKSISSNNDETTHRILILVEDQGRGSLVVLKGMMDGVVVLMNTWHDEEEDGR